MKPRKLKLAVPCALVVAGCTGDQRPPCLTITDAVCLPDGGHPCREGCGNPREADGGIAYDGMGQPICLC